MHLRLDRGGARWRDFWSLSAIGFLVLAVDELTQATIFLSHALERIGARAPAGFHDLDAFLLTVLLLAVAAVLVRYAPAVLKLASEPFLLGGFLLALHETIRRPEN